MKLAYVRWRDASYDTEEVPLERVELADLHEVGFLVAESVEAVKLSVEYQEGAETGRLCVTIPKCNILEMRTRELSKAFPSPRSSRRKMACGTTEQTGITCSAAAGADGGTSTPRR